MPNAINSKWYPQVKKKKNYNDVIKHAVTVYYQPALVFFRFTQYWSQLHPINVNFNPFANFVFNNSWQEISQVESKESLFFDPTSPFFEYILFSCLGSLGFVLVCGLLYQVLYRKRKSSQCKYWYYTMSIRTLHPWLSGEISHLLLDI